MRIFWLGMHKVLVRTELPRLRQLGFEVFAPPYLSSVQDQSANLNWDKDQPTTLPKDIFQKLSEYNFFFNTISPEMAEILNHYFDAVIVTIAVPWLASILKVYHKKIIFRTYGQSYLLSEHLWNIDLFRLITERDNFWFVPHAAQAVRDEHQWLKERERIVPYVDTDDVFAKQDTWSLEGVKRKEIMMLCPNIDNLYYRRHFHFLKKNFKEDHYRFYGVQLRKMRDSQIVGTMPREDFLNRFSESAGYLYSYTDGNVCYLPPIEMMIIGGPVIFLKGSLLDRNFEGSQAPGRAETVEIAKKKCNQLLANDRPFIQEVIASQKEIRRLYSPHYVWPIFDQVFSELLAPKTTNQAPRIIYEGKSTETSSQIYLLHHFPKQPIIAHEGHYAARDGIPRVMRLVVRALCEKTQHQMIITCRKDQLVAFHGFFSIPDFPGRVRFYVIDPKKTPQEYLNQLKFSLNNDLKAALRKILIFSKLYLIKKHIVTLVSITRKTLQWFKKNAPASLYGLYQRLHPAPSLECPPYIHDINQDPSCKEVIVPHYYLFPEALFLEKKIALYLPDYIPHFFEKTGEFKDIISLGERIGKKIAGKASTVLTSSEFTKSYLPQTGLEVPLEKIKTFYLPNLNLPCKTILLTEEIQKQLGEQSFIFYPTQARANKNLSLLLKVFNALLQKKPNLKLVLTGHLHPDPKSLALYKNLRLKSKVIFLPKISDETLAWLYQHAACLCFTSLMEGNFPPQIFEALGYGTPVVATRLPLITELLDSYSDHLLLCEPNNIGEFVSKTLYALEQRAEVLEKQKVALEIVESRSSWSAFASAITTHLK